jgi:hypothetical protein
VPVWRNDVRVAESLDGWAFARGGAVAAGSPILRVENLGVWRFSEMRIGTQGQRLADPESSQIAFVSCELRPSQESSQPLDPGGHRDAFPA